MRSSSCECTLIVSRVIPSRSRESSAEPAYGNFIWDGMFRTALTLQVLFWLVVYAYYGGNMTRDDWNPCRTQACRDAFAFSQALRSSNSALACNDFYEYACAGWGMDDVTASTRDMLQLLDHLAVTVMSRRWMNLPRVKAVHL